MNCACPSATSSASPALRRSEMAPPSASVTSGSAVFRPLGVCTASAWSNGVRQYGAMCEYEYAVPWVDPASRSQKRRNSNAPRESVFSFKSQFAKTEQALPTATGRPDDVGRKPVTDSRLQVFTSWSRVIIAAYCLLLNTSSCIACRVNPFAALSAVMMSPIRVRSDRGVASSPMIRAYSVSGWAGLDNQYESLELVT